MLPYVKLLFITMAAMTVMCWQIGRPASVSSGRAGRGGGELLVSIGHQPGAVDKLTVVVLKARNLPASTSDVANGCLATTLTGALTACNWPFAASTACCSRRLFFSLSVM